MTEYRTATAAEVSLMLDWAAAEVWNPGLDDAAAFHAADPAGFFVAVEDGTPVACISVVNHSPDFAFLGLYIALPSHRAKGIGYRLWQHALNHARQRTIGLDGVPDQQANYAASGFRLAGRTTRYSGRVAPDEQGSIRTARDTDIPTLIAREAAVTGIRKQGFLTAWFQTTPHRETLLAEDGFCTVRKCRDGAKIGPLVADSPESADALIRHAATRFGSDVTLDVPDSSDALARHCRALGLTPGFDTARMYRGTPPVTGHAHFAVTTLELG